MERDIVDWLRQLLNQRIAAFGEKGLSGCRYGEAADEIDRLRAALEEIAKGRWTDSHGRNPVATREAEIAVKALTR